MPESNNLDERYGRTPGRLRLEKRWMWIVAGAFALILVGWVVWAGLDGANPSMEYRDTRHQIIDENSISVTYEVSLPTNTAASCAVQALNENFTVVGWKIVDLPPSETYTRSFTEIVHTTERSVSGLIYRCWLT